VVYFPEQAARDQSMREGMEDALRQERGEPSIYGSAGNANVWADRTKNRIQFLYDAEEAAERWWKTSGRWEIVTDEPLVFKL
jgi:salicylate hydroxylase